MPIGTARFPAKVTNPNRRNYGEEGAIPVPWDPVYQERFSRLIRKLGGVTAPTRCWLA